MSSNYKLVFGVVVGAALGAAAIQGLHAQAKPPAYVITETDITDQAAFNEFSPKVPATMQPFGGKYLIRGGRIVTLQGQAPQRFIVTAFDSMEKAQRGAIPRPGKRSCPCATRERRFAAITLSRAYPNNLLEKRLHDFEAASIGGLIDFRSNMQTRA